MKPIQKNLYGLVAVILLFANLGYAQTETSREILYEVTLNPKAETSLDLTTNELPASTIGQPVILEFQSVASDAPIEGYFEVYLVTRSPNDTQDLGHYAGNLDFFGADAASRASSDKENVIKTIDISDLYEIDGQGVNFAENGVAIMFKPVLSDGKTPNATIGSVRINTDPT